LWSARFNQRTLPLNQSLRDVSIYYLLKALESRVASDRLGALFGVSILEDKGSRAQWVMGYRVSNVKWRVIFFRLSIFDEEKPRKSYISYWISDSESCQSLIDLRYEIFLFISYNYNVHLHYLRILSCGCWPVVAAKIWILRARDFLLNYFISMPLNISQNQQFKFWINTL
jgi:hypothetical protein